ncbi:unnamed protein product [Acanthoscelides obtectus]|uniref:Uncharacterized protein n=1 Tax=Acanthoscelides obtectus TaxID=200917 RepID=A0A9P0QIJ4_ACAOB|nr:unnamed protein product [Acanthoscelides obtectus]CAK1684142.1 hypothetical protein AOBTE_LOCUS34654 [Acanthoscelides obtectus]
MLLNPNKTPNVPNKGLTVLIPQDLTNTEDPANTAQLPAFPTLYKVVHCLTRFIPTNNYKRFILKNLQQTDKCRYGCQDSETIQHVTGGCQAFAPTDYKERHDIAAKIIHQELAYKFKLIECKLQYYKYTPQCVLENDKYKLYWDSTVLTDQYIKQNRPDIIIVDKGAPESNSD